MNKEQIDHAMLFTMYSTLYMNDMVCNAILELENLVPKDDKEAVKIYGALKKRCKNYLKSMDKIYDSHNYFMADYNSVMDEAVDDLVCNFETKLCQMLNEHNVDNSIFLAKAEVVRFITESAHAMVDGMIDRMKNYSEEARNFEKSKLGEIRKILVNFNKWIYRKVDVKIAMNEDCDAYKALIELQGELCNYENFDKAYKFAYANYKSIRTESGD